jgi:peroxiredoxin
MLTTRLKYGIPDIELSWSCGGTVNPSCFAGHQLVVLFLPKDREQQRAEFESYKKLAEEMSGTDAWFIVVGDETHVQGEARTPVVLDPDGKAWGAFKEVAREDKLDRPAGAAFFFTRGGSFHRAWPGRGNANAVVEELLSRA